MAHFWIGVASRDHVQRGIDGGFCQLGHGKEAPIRRLSTGDWLAYYAPRSAMQHGAPVQAFTAVGRIKDGVPYRGDTGAGFRPWRRDVAWEREARDASIRPLLDRLDLTMNKQAWGIVFRRSVMAVSQADFRLIAQAMGVKLPPE